MCITDAPVQTNGEFDGLMDNCGHNLLAMAMAKSKNLLIEHQILALMVDRALSKVRHSLKDVYAVYAVGAIN